MLAQGQDFKERGVSISSSSVLTWFYFIDSEEWKAKSISEGLEASIEEMQLSILSNTVYNRIRDR